MKHMTRRALALLLTLSMVCSLLGTTTFAAGGTWTGSGTADDPYLIEDADDLMALATAVNGGNSETGQWFKVTNDITVSDWIPIGTNKNYPFKGYFDGDNHTITINNVAASAQSGTYIGLFGYLMGYFVANVIVDGVITGSNSSYCYVGGIAGYLDAGTSSYEYNRTIVNCVNNAAISVSGSQYYNYAGGIVGDINATKNQVNNCYNTGNVTSEGYAGGIFGYANNGTVQYCYSNATVSGRSGYTGEVYGKNWGTVTECYSASTWEQVSDKEAWVTAANALVTTTYVTLTSTDFWSIGASGPEHALCDHRHAVDDLGTVTAPTCTEKGYTTYTCSICGKEYKADYVDALGHELETTTVAATCTEAGSTTQTCTREGCGYEETTVIPATGHTADESKTVESDTYWTYTCATCGEQYIVYKDARLQAMTISGVEVSFSEDGSYEWEYDSENDRLRSTNYNKNSSTSQTTITMTAEADFTVSFDYAVSSESNYDKLTITLDSETVANAISGTTTGSCSKELTAGTHTLVVKYVKDSSSQSGDDRGYLSNIVIEVLCLHENKTLTGHTDATCTEAAYTTYVCGVCGKTLKIYDEGSAPLGHTWGEDNICTVCGAPRVWDGTTTTEPSTQDGVYLIGTGEELAWFADKVNSSSSYASLNAKLTADIDLGDHEWTPIGKSSTYYYSGTFDGDGHSITGLNAVAGGSGNAYPAGLFGYVKAGTIKNLAVHGTVTGYAGSNEYQSGKAGGIVGQSNGITLEGCANYATVTSGNYAGGLIGSIDSTRTAVSITNCYNAGDVTGSQAGGFTGELAGSYAVSGDQIKNGFTCGTIALTSGETYLGTIWGWVNSSAAPTSENFYYLNAQTYADSYTVGTAKTAEEFKTLASELGDAFVDSEELGHPILTWEVKEEPAHEHTYTYASNDNGTHTGTCSGCGETVTEPCVLDSTGECTLCGWKQPGSQSAPIQIGTAAQLMQLSDEVNGYTDESGVWHSGEDKKGVYYELTADIELDGSFRPIGTYDADNYQETTFSGHFDGQGHTVTLNITDRTGSNARVGLFGSVYGYADDPATIENVITAGSVISYGGTCIGGLVGQATGTVNITNCGNAAAVSNFDGGGYYSSNGAAGLVGRVGTNSSSSANNGLATISGCFNVGTVTADGYAAGIVYDALGDTTIQNCYDMGTLTAYGKGTVEGQVGGLVAIPDVGKTLTMTNCYAGGTYSATYVGAVVATIAQSMSMTNVLYADKYENWISKGNAYGWNNTTPTSFSDVTALAGTLGSAFKDATPYTLLSWQSAAAEPSVSTHVHSYTDVVTAPTCTGQGYTTHTCECGYSYVDSYVDALGHTPGEYTHNENDTHSYTCTVCGETITEACTYDAGVVTTEPTENEDGERTYTCTVCGGKKTEVIPATEFKMDEDGNYLIRIDDDLARLALKVSTGETYEGKTFLLENDVNATAVIGSYDYPFSGTFDGQGHTVTLTLSGAAAYNGLFGYVLNATIERVIVAGTVNCTGAYTGGIAGRAVNSLIQYCGNEAAVSGAGYVGGIVGSAYNTIVKGCYNRGAISNQALSNDPYTGGIAGNLTTGSSVSYCYNTGTISGAAQGIASYEGYTYTGGIAGMGWTSSIIYCYSAGAVTGGKYTGGVLGSGNLYYQENVYSYYLEGSASAAAGTGSDSSDYLTSATETELKTAGVIMPDYFVADDETAPKNSGYLILKWESDPDAGISYVTEIRTVAQLYQFANAVKSGYQYEGVTVKLMNDIALTEGSYWSAVGDVNQYVFAGTFDGQGYTISNLKMVEQAGGSQGFFSALPQSATVKNLNVTGTMNMHQCESGVGAIVGWNQGTVENCTANVTINASACSYVGGIVGDNAGTVRNCVNYGNVNGVNSYGSSVKVGGVIGRVEPAYDASGNAVTAPVAEGIVNYGNVTGYQYVGGLVGGMFNEDYDLDDCGVNGGFNAGEVTCTYYAGWDGAYCGLLVGNAKGDIVNCYYVLDTKTVPVTVGDAGGENYARPVTADYAATAAFAAKLGTAFTVTDAKLTVVQTAAD